MDEYSVTLDELFDLQQFSIKMGLENITSLCKILKHPENSYPAIHIAGTNGKGSTAFVLQKILTAFNLKTGLYTSPHLIDFRERIRVNDSFIEKDHIYRIWKKIKPYVYSIKATFFDTTTAIALDYFNLKKVDVAILETGLGGRLDSTNIINPRAAIITPIDIDHSKQLGLKLKEITAEKAGIIKNGVTLFVGNQKKIVDNVLNNYKGKIKESFHLKDLVKIENIRLYPEYSIFNFYDRHNHQHFKDIYLNLPSKFQIDNTLLAYLVARWYLTSLSIQFSENTFREVLKSIHWPGRLDKVSSNPDIYVDVSHNVAGFKNTLEFINKVFKGESLHLLFGILEDKDYRSIVKLVSSRFNQIVVTEPLSQRALEARILKREFARYGKKVKLIKEIENAFDFSIRNLKKDDILFIMGSHFLAGSLLEKFHKSLDMKSILI